MRKTGVIAAVICAVCVIIPLKGRGISLGMSRRGPRLTAQQGISEARRNARKPGSSFAVLREIVANAETRRIGDQALEQARTHHIKLFKDGILVDFLRSGGFLVAETEPRTNDVIALHLVSLGPEGVPKDAVYPCYPAVKLVDTEGLVKATAEFTGELYSTRPSEATSLESKFYGGRFPRYGGPEAKDYKDYSLFAVPRSLLKLKADPNEVREVAALYGWLQLSGFQYAVSMPAFAASPWVATQAAGEKWEALKAEFLRNNRMNPDLDLDPGKIASKEQLREQIDLLRRLDRFMEGALTKEANPTLVKANISVATLPLGVSFADYGPGGQMLYASGTASWLVIYWQRLPMGGFAVNVISEAG